MDYSNHLHEYYEREIKMLSELDVAAISEVMNLFEKACSAEQTIFICGNGGSAATASHFCCDFNKGVNMDREKKYNFECLSDNVPTMMAVANDIGYDEVFAFPLKNKLSAGDIVVGISGSGNSKNVINALSTAKDMGAITVGFVGYDGGQIKKMVDYCVHIAIDNMQIVEDLHMILDHSMMYVLSNQ